MALLLDQLKNIKTFAFDMDGVLTDGTVWITESNTQVRRMSIRDGYALQLAVKMGYNVVVISGANSEPVKSRLNGLGIQHIYMGIQDKRSCLIRFIEEKKLDLSQVLFMGDDIPDWEIMQAVGFAAAPLDAAAEIKQISTYISPYKGGEGCVRDIIEKVLKLNHQWPLHTRIASR